ncbi:MAG: DUF6686 family protein [Cyclobacteriaceae bacterium]
MKLINSTANGQIFICPCQRKLHLEFRNLFLLLTYDQFNSLNTYVRTIDRKYFLYKNRNEHNRRKLLLRFGKSSAYLVLHENEFLEFKALLSLKNEDSKWSPVNMITNNINLN